MSVLSQARKKARRRAAIKEACIISAMAAAGIIVWLMVLVAIYPL